MKNALEMTWAVVVFQVLAIGMFGAWGLLGIPALAVVAVLRVFVREYKLEVLRREMLQAQAAAQDAAEKARLAAEELARAEAELTAALAEKARVREALRAQDWLVVRSEDVSLN